MNELKDKDLREALRRMEKRRKRPDLPNDFCDKVMREIEPQRNKRNGTLIVAILSIAASVAIVLMMVFSSSDSQQSTVAKNDMVKVSQSKEINISLQPINPPEETRTTNNHQSKKKETIPQAQKLMAENKETRKVDDVSIPTNVDSLDYYIDKIEQELAHVDESLYIERINKVIQADERLQRIVNQYILQRINSDDNPQSAHTINPQTPNNYEE